MDLVLAGLIRPTRPQAPRLSEAQVPWSVLGFAEIREDGKRLGRDVGLCESYLSPDQLASRPQPPNLRIIDCKRRS